MDAFSSPGPTKTKIVATIGPASESPEVQRKLVRAGVDVFRLNFAHGAYDWFERVVTGIREVSTQLDRPIAILADLAGPKIRLGELPDGGLRFRQGAEFVFVRGATTAENELTCTYEPLVDDLRAGDRVLLADGTVTMRVIQKDAAAGRATCRVEQPGFVRSKQGVNLPGAVLSTPSLTEKDRRDLLWALDHQLDYVSLSFVRRASDILELKQLIAERRPAHAPWVVAKIEKVEAIDDLEAIVEATDVVMVARGDLGVEADIAQVPMLQKRIIQTCNAHRVPVITATQMLDSMQKSELPTRAEVSDVANAVLDGTDAVMLSGETAVGDYPDGAVAMMNRIANFAEPHLEPRPYSDTKSSSRTRATEITESVTHGAVTAAHHLDADLIVVATRGGRTAMAVSKQRGRTPILALTDSPEIARRMCLFWGVHPVCTAAVTHPAPYLIEFVEKYGRDHGLLRSGSRVVIVGSTNWTRDGHDMLLVHVVN